MRGFRHWIGSATLLLAPTVTFAQVSGPSPGPLPFPSALPTPAAPTDFGSAPSLGGGTVVSKPPVTVTVQPVAKMVDQVELPVPSPQPPMPKPTMTPMPMPKPMMSPMPMPPGTGAGPMIPMSPSATTTTLPIPGVVTTPAPTTTIPGVINTPSQNPTSLLTDTWQMMLGTHGPVNEDLYFRTGPSIPFGDSSLGKNLDVGWNATLGGRSLFFDPEGSAAWVIDAHLSYTYNNASGQEIVFFRDEACTIRALTRWSVGLGAGRDWFSNNPGFIFGQFDMNFSWGVDAGMRWGTGHVDLNPASEIEGYRRHHDVFGQSFLSVHGGAEIPMDGWTMLLGGRLEWNTTYSDILPASSTLQGIDVLFNFGVRY